MFFKLLEPCAVLNQVGHKYDCLRSKFSFQFTGVVRLVAINSQQSLYHLP